MVKTAAYQLTKDVGNKKSGKTTKNYPAYDM